MTIGTRQIGPYALRVAELGDGPVLLFLHGHETHPGEAPFLHRLARTHRVVAPELPGFGSSTGFEAVHDVLDIALLYRELALATGAEQVDVVGHGLGGMLAGELAAVAGPLVRRLVLVGAYGLWLDDAEVPDPFGFTGAALVAAKYHDPAKAGPEPTIFEPVPDDPFAEVLFRSANLAVAGKFLWPLPERGLVRRLPYVKAETLVVHGASDGLVPMAHAAALAGAVPGARLEVLAGTGHVPFYEDEDAFFAVVEPFLASA